MKDVKETAFEKTANLERKELPVDQLIPNPENPNSMTPSQFNMLADNITRVGITDPIFVVQEGPDKYQIVGGEHRWQVAKLMGFETVPCTITTSDKLDADQRRFQLVRHNIIHGAMSAEKFVKMVESLTDEYTDEIAAEMFGFDQQEDFNKLVASMTKSVPTELQEDFKKAAKDIKTVDGLAKLLNSMLNTHGDSLPYGYMVVDFGGQDSIWLRMRKGSKTAFLEMASTCKGQGKSVDETIEHLLKAIAKGDIDLTPYLEAASTVEGIEGTTYGTIDEAQA